MFPIIFDHLNVLDRLFFILTFPSFKLDLIRFCEYCIALKYCSHSHLNSSSRQPFRNLSDRFPYFEFKAILNLSQVGRPGNYS